MSITGIPTEVVQVPFTGGLNLKAHGHAIEPPELTKALNVEFDEVGGLRPRKPYASIGTDILGGGTLSNVRKIVDLGNELLTFTATGLYSWSETLSKHVSRGTHLAVKVTEVSRFVNPTDQVFADRAQLSSLIVYVWVEIQAGTTLCYLAAIDATTEATVIAPTSFGAGNVKPRVVALDTKILVTWTDGTSLLATSIDPASPSFTTAGPTTLAADGTGYDIVRDPTADRAIYVARNAAGTAYRVGRVTAALAATSSAKARAADGAVAIAVTPVGSLTMVLRTDTLIVKGDLIATATLIDSTVNTTVANIASITTIDHIAAAFRSVTNGGEYRCYTFISTDETDAAFASTSLPHTYYNYIDTAAAVGSAGLFVADTSVGSRAFDYGGTVYVWLAFGRKSDGSTLIGKNAAFQNSYYLYDDAIGLHSKAVYARGGGKGYTIGHLPGVALISGSTGFAWCAVERDYIDLGPSPVVYGTRTYADRAPRDVVFTFDSDEARRTARCGDTLYVTGGQVLQYDGEGLTEVGFEVFPWYSSATDASNGDLIADGTYSYKLSDRWTNARGDVERSTVATGSAVTASGGAPGSKVTVNFYFLSVTRKRGSRRAIAREVWRTAKDPTTESPFYLASSRDPAATGDNGYVVNDPTLAGLSSFSDNFTDAVLTTKELHPENAGTLPRVAPPGASIILASESRVFLAGIPGQPYSVAYSLLRNAGEVASFHPALTASIPPSTGPITGLALWQETLIVFTASAVYQLGGQGFDNLGGGSTYGPARLIAADVGALSHDTIAVTPVGVVFFSRKGWHLLNGGLSLDFIGAKVDNYNTDTWVAAQVVESQHQVRFLSTSRMLMWDYLVNAWAEWSQTNGLDLGTWRGSPMLLDSTAVKKEDPTFAAVTYDMDVEMLIKPAGPQGMVRVRRILVLGEYKGDHVQRIRLRYDYALDTVDDKSMTFSALVVGEGTQFRHGPSRQRFEAVHVRITVALGGVVLTGLALEVGVKRGLYQRLPAAQKQ